MRSPLILTLLFISLLAFGQPDSCWTVNIVPKGQKSIFKVDDYYSNNKGFSFYRNCIYSFTYRNGNQSNGRLLGFTNDTLTITNFLNEAVAESNFSQKLDTFKINYRDLKSMIIGERQINFDNYDFKFRKDTVCDYIESSYKEIYLGDTTKYEIVPFATYGGISFVYESFGKTYWYQGSEKIPKPILEESSLGYKKRNIFGLIPSNVEEINGLAFGAWAENLKNDEINKKDSLTVTGLTIEVNPVMLFILVRGVWEMQYGDSIDYFQKLVKNEISTTKNGLSLSVLGSVGLEKINGVNIGGINTVVAEVNGLSISGLNNFCYSLNGLSIALIRNKSTISKGLQIGLINKSKEMKGVQIGLWNTNGKRSLPFINWQFKKSIRR